MGIGNGGGKLGKWRWLENRGQETGSMRRWGPGTRTMGGKKMSENNYEVVVKWQDSRNKENMQYHVALKISQEEKLAKFSKQKLG